MRNLRLISVEQGVDGPYGSPSSTQGTVAPSFADLRKRIERRYYNLVSRNLERHGRVRYILALPVMYAQATGAMIFSILAGLLTPRSGVSGFWARVNPFHIMVASKRLPVMALTYDAFAPYSRAVRRASTGHGALDRIYNWVARRQVETRGLDRLITGFWINCLNCQAVRNRLLIVRMAIVESALQLVEEQGKQEVRLLSIACGSAQAVLEAAAVLQRRGITLRCLLTDKSDDALKYARGLAVKYGVDAQVRTEAVTAADAIRRHARTTDLVEVVGLADYFTAKHVLRMFRLLYEVVQPGTIFITGHIHSNREKFWVWWVINWPMLYKTRPQFLNLITEAGWEGVLPLTEPHGIHTVAIARR